jgi:hypothetical protein
VRAECGGQALIVLLFLAVRFVILSAFVWLCCQPLQPSHRFIAYLLYSFSFLRLIWVWQKVGILVYLRSGAIRPRVLPSLPRNEKPGTSNMHDLF